MLLFSCVITFTEYISQQASNVYVELDLAQVGDNLASQFSAKGKMMDISSNFFVSSEVSDTGILVPPIGIFWKINSKYNKRLSAPNQQKKRYFTIFILYICTASSDYRYPELETMWDHESITVRFIEITGLTRSEAIEFLDVGNLYAAAYIFFLSYVKYLEWFIE